MSNEITLEAQNLAKEAENILVGYKDFRILDNGGLIGASDILKAIKAKANQLEETRKLQTQPIDLAKKRIMDFFRKPLEALMEAETIIKRAMLTYQQEQERKRKEDEARLQELARREEERKRKALEERAAKAETKGDLGKAEELRQKAEEVSVPVPVVTSQVPRIEGIATKTVWKYRIINTDLVPRDYLIVDEKKLQQIATATKGTLKVTGVEFYSEELISARVPVGV